MVASYWFTPNYFVETKTPTYGYNVSGNWANAPNLFGAGGNSVQNYAAGVPFYAYVMKQTHSKSAAVISYGPAITSSYDACNTAATVLKQAGYNVSYEDVGAQLGGSFSSAVQRMQQAGTDFVMSCMQESDNITMARDIQQYGLKITQLWAERLRPVAPQPVQQPDARGLPEQQRHRPLRGGPDYAEHLSRHGQLHAGDEQVRAAFTYNGVAVQGWQSAALLADAIKAAGNNLTQANIINITNHFTANNSGGLSTVTNWATAHTTTTYPTCTAFVKVEGTKFVPVFGKGNQVFVCFAQERRRTRCRSRRRPAPREHDAGLPPGPGRSRRGSGALPGFRHPRHSLRLHLCHGGGRAGAHLSGHRGLQLRLRCPGLRLGVHLHPAGAEREPAHLAGLRASRWCSWRRRWAWSRPLPVPQDPQLQHHGQAGHRDHPVRGHPRPAPGHLREQQPVQPAEHPVQPGHRLLPHRRHPVQRDLHDRGGGHRRGPVGPGRPHALHQSRTADAGCGREPAPGPARRGQRRPGGGVGLGHLQPDGRAGRGPAAPRPPASSRPRTTPR